MRKSRKKKSGAKKGCKIAETEAGVGIDSKGKGKMELVNKQPQVKQQAPVAHRMFLYTDDAWSLRYFDDLHFKEREVFG
jgi:hypothetical protein